MASLKPTLTITGTAADLGTTLSLSETPTGGSLTVTTPIVGVSKVIASATPVNIIPAGTSVTYLYIKHSGTTDGSTATAQLVDVENSDDEAFARLGAGEFLFMPFNHAGVSVGVQLQVNHASNVEMEYAYWTKA